MMTETFKRASTRLIKNNNCLVCALTNQKGIVFDMWSFEDGNEPLHVWLYLEGELIACVDMRSIIAVRLPSL